MPVMQVMTAGRMALLMGPEGASFAVWECGDHKGAQLVNEPVSLSWNELVTNDLDKSRAFYSALFSWSCAASNAPMEYTEIKNAGNMNGGMLVKRPEMGDMPCAWGVYFAVESCDATTAKCIELGGAQLAEATDVPSVGRFAVLAEHQGGVFTAFQLETD